MNTEDQGTVAPSNIIINGAEYTPEDAQSYIELGKKTREAEQKWNTSLDNVWPEYGRLSQERKTWQTEKQKLEGQLSSFQTKQTQGVETSADIAQAREAARKLGLAFNEDFEKAGYVKKEELDSYFSQKQQEQQAVQKVLDEADKLSKEINGSDGRPKFNKKAVIAYANAYSHTDLMKAYEEMNEEQLKPWKEEQLAKGRSPGLKTLKPSGTKHEPGEVRPKNDEEFKALLRQTIEGTDEGK